MARSGPCCFLDLLPVGLRTWPQALQPASWWPRGHRELDAQLCLCAREAPDWPRVWRLCQAGPSGCPRAPPEEQAASRAPGPLPCLALPKLPVCPEAPPTGSSQPHSKAASAGGCWERGSHSQSPPHPPPCSGAARGLLLRLGGHGTSVSPAASQALLIDFLAVLEAQATHMMPGPRGQVVSAWLSASSSPAQLLLGASRLRMGFS